jgi:chitodextrinase
MKKLILTSVLSIAVSIANCQFNPAYPYHAKAKKVIEMGWDMPTARFIRNNIAVMQQSPFDGLVFSPANSIVYAWELSKWQSTGRIDTTNLLATQWGSLKNSFLNLWSGDFSGFSYFDDSQWVTILANMRYYADLARRSGIDGICFDVEFYSTKSPWSYPDHGEGNTLAETKAKVRQRGAEVITAFQEAYPDIKILSMYMLSYVPARWELLPDFVNGMLDAITTAELIEGHEGTYYLDGTNAFFSSYAEVRTTFRNLRCDPVNFAKYDSKMQAGMATYDSKSLTSNPPGNAMRKKYEHDHYMGLAACDEYLWVYTEEFAFWNNPSDRPEGMPVAYPPWPGAVEAIASAKAKYKAKKALGWDMVNGSPDSTIKVSMTSSTYEVPTAPGSVTITVTASGGRVDLYENMQQIKSKSTSPYVFTVSNMPAGTFEFIAHVVTSSSTGTSNPIIVTVAADRQAPSIPQGLTSTGISPTAFTLSWNSSTDNIGVTGYEVFKDGISMGTTKDTTMLIKQLTCETNYLMTVKACDAENNWSEASTALNVASSSCGGDMDPPSVPAGLIASAINTDNFILSWYSSTDYSGVSAYEVYVDSVFFASTKDTSVLINLLDTDSSYSLMVRAIDSVGQVSVFSAAIVVRTDNGEPPSIPNGLIVHNIASEGFTLNWNPSTDNTKVAGYEVDIWNSGIGTISGDSMDVTGLGCGIAYSVSVRAFDDAGNFSAASSPLTVKTIDCTLDTLIVKEEIWTNIPGYPIVNIPVTKTPDSVATLSTLEIPVNLAYNYGCRIRGFIIPPVTGKYTFYLCSDDNGELWLSEDNQPANKVKIAYIEEWTNSREWTKSATQKSSELYLTAGQRYYFEALMKQGGGGSNLAVGWNIPGTATIEVIGTPNIDKFTDDFEAPLAVGGLDSASVTAASFILLWLPAQDNVKVTGYDVFKNGQFYGSTNYTTLLISGLLPSTAYTMTVKAKDEAGYVSDASAAIIVKTDFNTAISNTDPDIFQVYPNPANSFLTIANIPPNAVIKVTSSDGKTISEIKTVENSIHLDVRKWGKGFYLIRMVTATKEIVKKIVIE